MSTVILALYRFYLPTYPSTYPPTYLYIYPSIHLSIYPSIHPSIMIYLFHYQSIHLSQPHSSSLSFPIHLYYYHLLSLIFLDFFIFTTASSSFSKYKRQCFYNLIRCSRSCILQKKIYQKKKHLQSSHFRYYFQYVLIMFLYLKLQILCCNIFLIYYLLKINFC